MTKQELIRQAAEKAGVRAVTAQKVIEAALGVVGDRLAEGEKTVIRDFGTFDTFMSRERTAHVPGSGRKIIVPARKRIRFKAHKGIEYYSQKNL